MVNRGPSNNNNTSNPLMGIGNVFGNNIPNQPRRSQTVAPRQTQPVSSTNTGITARPASVSGPPRSTRSTRTPSPAPPRRVIRKVSRRNRKNRRASTRKH